MGNIEDSLTIITHLLEIMSEEIKVKDPIEDKEELNELVFTLRDLTKQVDQHLDELEG